MDFELVMRGYSRSQVDRYIEMAERAVFTADPRERAALLDELRGTRFELSLRGYERSQVDKYVRAIQAELGI